MLLNQFLIKYLIGFELISLYRTENQHIQTTWYFPKKQHLII